MKRNYIAPIILVIAGSVFAGFENLLCGKDPAKIFSPCYKDCQTNHARSGGKCGNTQLRDFNCYCTDELIPELSNHSFNCNLRGKGLDKICVDDCRCNHGALWGYCEYHKKSCRCTGEGLNKLNFGCPFKNAYEFVENSEKKMGPEVLGESGMMFLKKAKEAFNPNPLPRLLKALKIK